VLIELSPPVHFDATGTPVTRDFIDLVARTLRAHYRKVLAVAAGIAVIALLAVNRAMVLDSLSAASSASPWWLAAAIGTAVLTVPASALCTVGASGRDLPLGRTTAVELAGTFLNRIAPAGIGRATLSIRYQTRHGITPERAVSTVAIGSIAGGIAHFSAALGAWALAAHTGATMPKIINTHVIMLAGLVLCVALSAGLVLFRVRPHLAGSIQHRSRALARDVGGLRSDARSSSRLLGGAFAVHLTYAVCFVVSLRAAGINVDPMVAALAYFAGSTVASMAPSPAGLGAAEVALAGAVVTIGVQPDLAVAGVLIYRLATYWMLSLAGYVSWMTLRRRGILA
jgi:undecaprenyl-diphosphatase